MRAPCPQVRPGVSVDTSELMAGPPKASTLPEASAPPLNRPLFPPFCVRVAPHQHRTTPHNNPQMEALVVSRETTAGAALIQRQRRGRRPLLSCFSPFALLAAAAPPTPR